MKKSRVVEGEDDSSSGEETSATRRLSMMKGRTSAVRNNRRSVAFRQAPAALKKEQEEEEQAVPDTTTTPPPEVAKATIVEEAATSPVTPTSGEPEALPPAVSDEMVLSSSSQISPSLSPTTRASRASQKCPPLEKVPVVVVKRRVPRSADTRLPATAAESMLSIGKELNPTTMGGGGDSGSVEKSSRAPSSPQTAATLVWLNPRYDTDNSPGGPMSEAAWEARHGVPGRLGLSAHRAIRAELEHVYGRGIHEGFLQPVGAVTQKSRGQVAATGRAMRSVQSQCDAMNGFILGMWNSNAVKIATKTHRQ